MGDSSWGEKMNKKDKENMQNEWKNKPVGYWIGAGLVIGTGAGGGWGVVFGNITLGAALGAGVGILLMAILIKLRLIK